MTITHAAIMERALDTYLGSKEQWCTGSHAKTEDGFPCPITSMYATSHCAEGAVLAAAADLAKLGPDVNGHAPYAHVYRVAEDVLCGIEQVLYDEHPQFHKHVPGVTGDHIPFYNDGVTNGDVCPYDEVPGVGYEGIKVAFEKYLGICQEKGL
jgi:hypothetical protein